MLIGEVANFQNLEGADGQESYTYEFYMLYENLRIEVFLLWFQVSPDFILKNHVQILHIIVACFYHSYHDLKIVNLQISAESGIAFYTNF